MNWLTLSLLSALFYAGSNALTKLFQPKLSTGLGMFIFSIGVFVASAVMAVFVKSGNSVPKASVAPILLAISSGCVWAIGQYLLIVTFAKNAPISVALPIILSGIAVGGILTGVTFFGETLSLTRIIGIVIVLIGTFVLSK